MSFVSWLIGRRHYSRSSQRNSNPASRRRSQDGSLFLEALEGRLCPGVLALTPASIRAGYGISTFATDFTGQGRVLSVLFPDQGGVLATDMSGNVRLFPSDSDGQTAAYVPPTQTFDASDALGLAKVGANIYMAQEASGKVVQLNATGNYVTDVVGGMVGAAGIVANPQNGHLFVDDEFNSIFEVDPKARTSKLFVQSSYDYGLAISPDGKTLYAADFVDNHVFGFDTSNGKSVFDSGTIAGVPSGLAVGMGRFGGHLYVSTMDGSLLDIDLSSRTQTMLATGGQPGDFLTFDPNNASLLVTQTDRIVRIKFPTGPAVSFRVDTASSVLPGQPFVATITAVDADGRVAAGYAGTVKFISTDTYPGLVPPNYTFTSSDNSTHTFAAAFFTAGTQMLTVQDTSSASITGSATVTVNAAPATHLKITAPSSTVAGSSFDVTVAALDAYGNADPSYTGTVNFTSTDSASGMVLPASYTFAAADKGTHTFSGGVTLVGAGSQTITIADRSNANFTTSANVLVMPAAATHLVLSAPSSTVAGTAFDVTITAFDPYGNVDTNYSGAVSFRSTDTHPGMLPSDYSFSSADKGTHTFTGVMLFTAAAQSLTAQDTGNSSLTVTVPITVTPGPVHQFVIIAPASVSPRNTFIITVTAFDAYGNQETNYTGKITFASSDPSPAILPLDYTFTPDDKGTHTFGVVFFTPGEQTLIVTDTASGVASSVMIMVG